MDNEQILARLAALEDRLDHRVGEDSFSAVNVHRKYDDFKTRLKLPVYSANPTIGAIGDICVVGTAVKHCTASTPTWKQLLDTDGDGSSLTGINVNKVQGSYTAYENINAPLAARIVADIYNYYSTTGDYSNSSAIQGDSGGTNNQRIGQPFTIPTGGANLTRVVVNLKKTGTPADNVVAAIQGVGGGGEPDDVDQATATVAGSGLTTSFADYTFTFTSALAAGNYQIVIYRSGARDTSNYYTINQFNSGSDGWKKDAGGWATTNKWIMSIGHNDGTAGQIKIAKSTNNFDAKVFGFVPTSITSGNAGNVVHYGVCTGFSGLTIGSTYYLKNDGTVGTSAGTVSVKVGYALSATSLFVLLTPQ